MNRAKLMQTLYYLQCIICGLGALIMLCLLAINYLF